MGVIKHESEIKVGELPDLFRLSRYFSHFLHAMEVNRNSKITVQITIIVACAMALFSAGAIYSNINTQVGRNTSDIQILYTLDKEKTDWRNTTENTITRIETKLSSIEKGIEEIAEYIKEQ